MYKKYKFELFDFDFCKNGEKYDWRKKGKDVIK